MLLLELVFKFLSRERSMQRVGRKEPTMVTPAWSL